MLHDVSYHKTIFIYFSVSQKQQKLKLFSFLRDRIIASGIWKNMYMCLFGRRVGLVVFQWNTSMKNYSIESWLKTATHLTMLTTFSAIPIGSFLCLQRTLKTIHKRTDTIGNTVGRGNSIVYYCKQMIVSSGIDCQTIKPIPLSICTLYHCSKQCFM